MLRDYCSSVLWVTWSSGELTLFGLFGLQPPYGRPSCHTPPNPKGRSLIASQDCPLRDRFIYPLWSLHLHHRRHNSDPPVNATLGRRHGTASPPSDFPFNRGFWDATRYAHRSTACGDRGTVRRVAVHLLDIIWTAVSYLDFALPVHARLPCHQPWQDHLEEIPVSLMGYPEARSPPPSHHPSVLDWILHCILFY